MVAALTVDRTLELAAHTRQIFDKTRSLIAINRRRLNPWSGVSGGSQDGAEDGDREAALFHSIRTRLESGVLIPAPNQVWGAYGTRKTCTICTQKIQSDEVENEMNLHGAASRSSFGLTSDASSSGAPRLESSGQNSNLLRSSARPE